MGMAFSEIILAKNEALERLDAVSFDNNIRLQWNNRLGTSKGYCRILKGIAILSFNPILFQRSDYESCRKTVRHEICHAIEYFRLKRVSHSQDWARLMRMLGEVPDICHRENVDDLRKKPRDKLSVICSCGQVYLISTVRRDRMVGGERSYICRKCKSVLDVVAVSSRSF